MRLRILYHDLSEVSIEHTEFGLSKNGILKMIAYYPSGQKTIVGKDVYIVYDDGKNVFVGGMNKQTLEGDRNGKVFTMQEQLKMPSKFGVTANRKIWEKAQQWI